MTAKPMPMTIFALVALCPAALLGLGVIWGGPWIWAGFLYMAGLAIVIDQIAPLVRGDAAEGAEFPAGDALLVAVAAAHLVLMPAAVMTIAGPSGLSWGERLLLFLACGYWMGQVAHPAAHELIHPAAHELIHRRARGLFRLGAGIYVTLLFGHHASAHRLVHHRAVATPEDPNSAPAEMGFWTFAPRAWIGSFREGLRAENERRTRKPGGLHPYVVYLLGAAASIGLGYTLCGWQGALIWVGLAGHAQLQLLLADYVQHYGLTRARRSDGRFEPVSDRHSWNSPHWFSSALMLNAPRHSDHHAHPARPYPALRLPADGPMLPWPLPLACALAMWPRLWRRRMKPHLARWSA